MCCEKHGVRASPTLNSDICDHHPQIVRAAVELGWEILGHNQTNSVWLDALSPDEERETIRLTLSRITELTGRKPLGWLGSGLAETWHTLDFLADEGCLYVADWVNDDQPYMMDIGGKPLVSIPYSYEINDAPFIGYRNGTVDEFEAGDPPPIRHALRRGRPIRPGHGDLPAPLPDRRSPSHPRPRPGTWLYPRA